MTIISTIIYRDDKFADRSDTHPAYYADLEGRLVRMARFSIDGLSVFNFTGDEAVEIYKWYLNMNGYSSITDEFGHTIYVSEFVSILATSYANTGSLSSPSQASPSTKTIKELYEDKSSREKPSDAITEDDLPGGINNPIS